MASYNFSKTYNINKLMDEIVAAEIPIIGADLISSTSFTINTSSPLSVEQAQALTNIVNAHVAAATMQEIVTDKILDAMRFGRSIIASYGASNVLSGYSITQIQYIMQATSSVQVALNTGSLYVAIAELNRIIPDGIIITAPKITTVRNQIEDYLKIPRT